MDIKKSWEMARTIARREISLMELMNGGFPEAILKNAKKLLDQAIEAVGRCPEGQEVPNLLPKAQAYEAALAERETFLKNTLLEKFRDALGHFSYEEMEYDHSKGFDDLIDDLKAVTKGLSKEDRIAIIVKLTDILCHIRGELFWKTPPPLPEEPDFMKE